MKKTLFLVLITLFLASCASFKRCQQKFANTITDSVKIQVPISVLVPRDSVITAFVTDTTYLYKEIQQGRAKVIVERTHSITTVQARCDSVTIHERVYIKVPGPSVVWGVSPKFKTGFKVAFYLLVLTVGCIFVLAVNNRNLKKELDRLNASNPEQ